MAECSSAEIAPGIVGSGPSSLPSWPDILSLSTLSGGGPKRSLTMTAVRPGAALLFVNGSNPLGVFVGSFKNHPGMQHDLIADVFRPPTPRRCTFSRASCATMRITFSTSSRAYNVGRWGPLACGTVSKVGGAAVFFERLDYDYKEYYRKPVTGRTRDDINIDSAKLDTGLKAIQARLAKGIPSVVGLVYSPSTAITRGGDIDVNGTGGHTVPIVGCSADRKKFLYIDVYQEGSKLKYEGGHAGPDLFPDDCDYLGLFEVKRDASRGIDILRSTTPGKGTVFAWVSVPGSRRGSADALNNPLNKSGITSVRGIALALNGRGARSISR